MGKIYKKISTEVGYIEPKRDAIHLDFFKQQCNMLTLIGEVYAKFCERKSKKSTWYKYRLTINGVKEYQAINIEDYEKQKINTESAFSEVLNDSNSENKFRTIIIETYDWAYIVVCESFEFTIIDCR